MRDPDSSSGAPRHRITTTTYVVTFAALLALTTATFLLSFVDLGLWTGPVTVGIAVVKSALIALFFMHLIEEQASSWIAFLISFLLVGTLIGLALLDVASRWLPTS
jgi:cytochrome c oxidase subunit 4